MLSEINQKEHDILKQINNQSTEFIEQKKSKIERIRKSGEKSLERQKEKSSSTVTSSTTFVNNGDKERIKQLEVLVQKLSVSINESQQQISYLLNENNRLLKNKQQELGYFVEKLDILEKENIVLREENLNAQSLIHQLQQDLRTSKDIQRSDKATLTAAPQQPISKSI